jgi:hypothetical protein
VVNIPEKRLTRSTIANTSELGINPDAKEAILFALLGNEALCGEPIAIGNNPAVLMGKFSFARRLSSSLLIKRHSCTDPQRETPKKLGKTPVFLRRREGGRAKH